jgi:hypothetical protein
MTEEKRPTSGLARGHDETPDAAPPESPARERTRSRMRKLLLAATTMGTGACDPGPIVCDPLPPPITCTTDGNMGSRADRIYAAATWTQVGADLVARVRISFSLYQSTGSSRYDAALSFSGDPQLTRARLLRVDRQATTIEFDCLPDAGASTVAVFVPMTCSTMGACYRMELDVRQPQANARVPVTTIKTGC